jgi:hypothetical protein
MPANLLRALLAALWVIKEELHQNEIESNFIASYIVNILC